MKEIISRLKSLNELDVKITMIKKDMERLPKELAEKQVVPKNLRAAIEKAKAEILRLKMEADSIELEVKSGEETLKRYASQMNTMRTSKEFETVKRQMDAQRAWNKENEGKVLELLEQVDNKQKDIDKNTTALNDAEKVVAEESARVDKEVGELRAQYEALATQRASMAQGVPEKELSIYNRIVNGRGQAIAHVEKGICSACFMKIPPQVHNLALLARELVCCPSCGRILTAG
ncbi:MAG TPA: C4-type zinc ribbon domain-containing protein [Planctomycetota bacterium]|nr:C4-type zinc ribbon domain-containing protein [Planctomycetota bacterium]